MRLLAALGQLAIWWLVWHLQSDVACQSGLLRHAAFRGDMHASLMDLQRIGSSFVYPSDDPVATVALALGYYGLLGHTFVRDDVQSRWFCCS